MNKRIPIIAIAMALLLSGCRVENIHTSAGVTGSSDDPAVTDIAEGTSSQTDKSEQPAVSDTPDATAEATADADTTSSTASGPPSPEEKATEATTEATTTEATEKATTAEASSVPISSAETPTLPPASEAVEEDVSDEPADNIGTDSIGYTYDGEAFEIDPDYAYFIVNKEAFLPDDYTVETDTVQGDYKMETTAAYFCRRMIEAAKEDGIDLKVLSAYRTVKYQERLFERNVESRMDSGMTYEEAYADVSINIAPPGGSEHNAGLAVDIVTKKDWDTYTDFDKTKEFDWLVEHGPEYGYILRYLKGKEHITGYIYEPWHFRYVGVKYARDLQDSGLCMEEYFDLHGIDWQ